MEDTSAAGRRRYFALLRQKSLAERFEMTSALIQSVRELAEAGIRRRGPTLTDEEVRARLAEALYGAGVARSLRAKGCLP